MREVRAGDVVWFPPNTRHWHGASLVAGMVHMAITGVSGSKFVDWMEKVTDEQYKAA